MFETFVFNLGGGVREEVLDGRVYLVARCVMGLEGVLHGSNGPGFYPAKEWENAVPSWNMKPITNDHPLKDGKPATAADPTVIASSQLGFLLNTKYDGKLRTEAWFDSQKTQARCPTVFNALRSGQMIEVSTGLIVDQDKTSGEHKGRKYDWIARNHRPDHLAVLPGKVGACSIADGAGLLANEAITVENLMIANDDLSKRPPLTTPPKEPDVDKQTLVNNLIANSDLWAEEQRAYLMERPVEWLQKAVAAIPPKTPTNNAPPTPAPVPQTVQEWLVASKAPPEVVFAVNSSIEVVNAQKSQLVANIMANPNNKFTKEWLDQQPLPALQGIAAIATPAAPTTPAVQTVNGYPILQPNFAGQGAVVPVANVAPAPVQMPVMTPPVLNFGPPLGAKK